MGESIFKEGDKVILSLPKATGIVTLVEESKVTVKLDESVRGLGYLNYINDLRSYFGGSCPLLEETTYDLKNPRLKDQIKKIN